MYAFQYLGNPTSLANKMKSLADNGPLKCSKEHILVQMMPDTFKDHEGTTDKLTTFRDVQRAFAPGILCGR